MDRLPDLIRHRLIFNLFDKYFGECHESIASAMIISYYKDRFIEPGERVVPIEDRAFNFGDGVYEVARFYQGRPFGLEEHLERLEQSAQALRMELPCPLAKIREIVVEAVRRSGEPDVDVYFQISRGEAPRIHPFPKTESCLALVTKTAVRQSEEARQKGIDAITREDERWVNCYIKSLNLLPNVLAKQEAVDAGAGEAILVRDGVVTEGSSTNVFAVKKGVLHTYPADRRILNGITRRFIIAIARELGIEVREESFTRDSLFQDVEELMISSTTMEIMPVRSVDGHSLPSQGMGEVGARIWKAFRERIG